MAKVQFSKAVKYNGVRYPAHTPFEADDKDLKELKESGAFLLEEEKAAKPKPKKEEAKKEEKVTLKDVAKKQDKKK